MVLAQAAEINSGDTAWVLASAALVLFMTPGLAFFYGGMVRGKNVLGMLMQNVFCMGLVSVLWAFVAFSLAFGKDHGGIIGGFDLVGLKGLFSGTVPGFEALTIPALAFVGFQLMFAIITPALITGATADRMRFAGWVIFLVVWSLIVYAPVAHWVFSPEGWLFKRGALDFAGGTVVHVNAGIAALAVILVIGRRKGWPREAMPPHNLPFTLLGMGILWFGWFGFNAGSALAANGTAVQAFMNTHMAAAAAMVAWLIAERMKDGKATTLGAASGAVAGLVAITPCSGFVGGTSPIWIGLIAGVVCFLALQLKYKFQFDDSLDVIAVHLVGGAIGSIMVGLFADNNVNPAGKDGLFWGGGTELLVEQIIAVVAVMVFTFVVSWIIAKAIDVTIGLRCSPEEELEGLDLSQHAEAAYSFGELGSIGRV